MDNSAEPDPSTWRADLELRLLELVDRYVVFGVRQQDIFDAIATKVKRLREELEHDPDAADDVPARDVVDEPSNDWPAAETDRADR
ncbi:hypothetical protein J2W42_003538 [Rhizobium tibeticum]|uniref:hypothetical protein n=1 Tax=Rhizobium tibeticum TaxID=501024 RepID=UPI0027812F00|nr:hypothetical protein [Rhizobium tibeticum]MDP9810675.1 hypothetical protein [Rhizobium tibeticum]